MAVVSSGARVYHRDVPPEWAARLAAVSPKQEGLAWLHLAWEPGETPVIDGTTYNHPVERWVLWQVQPIQFVPEAIRAELDGPHPRSTGQFRPYRAADGTWRAAWHGGPCRLISAQQWALYRETGGFARPWWVMQGDHGGHRVALSAPERMLYEAEFGGAVDVPTMGALPYADFDERVVRAIAEHDQLAQFAGMAGLGHRYGEYLLRHLAAKEEQARAHTYDSVYEAAAEEFADELAFALAKDQPAWRPVVTDAHDRFDADEARASFIAGTMPGTAVTARRHTADGVL